MKRAAITWLVAVFCFLAIPSHTQVVDPKKTTEQKAEQKANQNINQTVDKGLNSIESGVKGLFKKKGSTDTKTAENPAKPETSTVKKDTVATVKEPTPQEPTSLQTYSKFDFVPGEKVVFYDDFMETNIGDFPASWNTTASGEVVTNNQYPGNWFKMIGEGCIALDNGLKLPENFTIEYDVVCLPVREDFEAFEYGFYLYSAQNPKDLNEGGAVPGLNGGIKMNFGYRATYSAYNEEGYTINGEKEDATMKAGKKYHLSFWIQKTRLRVYQDEVKIFDLPKVFKPGFLINMMRFEMWGESGQMVTNFRVAAGLPDMRNKLITEGKLITYGINFDVNSAKLKPESYGTLKVIADVLKENPTVKVQIVGHTDSDGSDATNLDLSKRRAASVKAELTKTFGIDAARMETDGKGETKPVAENNSVTNKALNRRVEFIKL